MEINLIMKQALLPKNVSMESGKKELLIIFLWLMVQSYMVL